MRSLLFSTFVLAAVAGAMGCGSDDEGDVGAQVGQAPIPAPAATDVRPPGTIGNERLEPIASGERHQTTGAVHAAGTELAPQALGIGAHREQDVCAPFPRVCAEANSVPSRHTP